VAGARDERDPGSPGTGSSRSGGPDAGPPTDWYVWHRPYDDPGSALSVRLGVVQEHVRRFLDQAAPGPLRVVSVCAGQCRDLLGVLPLHPRGTDVSVRAVEADGRNVHLARSRAEELGLAHFEVVEGDASVTDAYSGVVPADLVLMCGVFGNVSEPDIERAAHLLPQLCAPEAVVVWTRHRRPPDRTGDIRRWFVEAGFVEVAFEAPAGYRFAVGVTRWPGPPVRFEPGGRLFTFTGDGHLPA
jgi:hypothetical protein